MSATTARDMVDQLEAGLATNAGVVQVTIDGTTVRWDRSQALRELDHWRRRLARERGRRPTVGQINLGSAW